MLDPRLGNIHLDANALDPPIMDHRRLVSEFHEMVRAQELTVLNPHGVQQEIDNPRTPTSTQRDMQGIVTIQTNLTTEERRVHEELRKLICGSAAPGKHDADADHIFVASKYGGNYFVTHDQRLLKRKNEIATITGPRPDIVTLSEFMCICKRFGLT